MPVEQTCPKCGGRFMGSDGIGYLCPDCENPPGLFTAMVELERPLADVAQEPPMSTDREREALARLIAGQIDISHGTDPDGEWAKRGPAAATVAARLPASGKEE